MKLGVLLLLLLAACDGLNPYEARLVVRMEGTEFVRDSSGLAPVSFDLVNEGGGVAYLVGCPEPVSMVIEQRQGEAWRDAFQVNVVCLAIYTAQWLELRPGESHPQRPRWGSAGTFRLRVFYGTSPAEPWNSVARGEPFVVR